MGLRLSSIADAFRIHDEELVVGQIGGEYLVVAGSDANGPVLRPASQAVRAERVSKSTIVSVPAPELVA